MEIIGGYVKDGIPVLVCDDKNVETLYAVDINDGQAFRCGGLRPLAKTRWRSTDEDDIFKYRNKPMRKMNEQEIEEFKKADIEYVVYPMTDPELSERISTYKKGALDYK